MFWVYQRILIVWLFRKRRWNLFWKIRTLRGSFLFSNPLLWHDSFEVLFDSELSVSIISRTFHLKVSARCPGLWIQARLKVTLFCYKPFDWENSRHFVTSRLFSPRNDDWARTAEIPYWWRVATQFWLVVSGEKFASTRSTNQILVVTRRQYHGISAVVAQTSFRRETSGGVMKCRLLSPGELKQPRRRPHRRLQKNNRFHYQNNSSARASRFLVHFFDVYCTTTTWNLLIWRFMEDMDILRRISLHLFEPV